MLYVYCAIRDIMQYQQLNGIVVNKLFDKKSTTGSPKANFHDVVTECIIARLHAKLGGAKYRSVLETFGLLFLKLCIVQLPVKDKAYQECFYILCCQVYLHRWPCYDTPDHVIFQMGYWDKSKIKMKLEKISSFSFIFLYLSPGYNIVL